MADERLPANTDERLPGNPDEKIPIKLFVHDKPSALLVCPVCGFVRELDVSKYPHLGGKTVNARCRCNSVLSISFDFRNQIRRQVMLDGSFTILEPGMDDTSGSITIHNISKKGIGFSVLGGYEPMVGQRVHLEFHLDDRKHSLVEKDCIVRSVRGDVVGCEFENDDLGTALGFYLL